jgi:hypothetical protein
METGCYFATCECSIFGHYGKKLSIVKGWKSEAFQQCLGDEMHQPFEVCSFCRMRTAVQYSVIVVLLSMLSWPKSQAEELNHDEMVCALTGTCEMPFVDRRVRGLTTSVSPRPPLVFRCDDQFQLQFC